MQIDLKEFALFLKLFLYLTNWLNQIVKLNGYVLWKKKLKRKY